MAKNNKNTISELKLFAVITIISTMLMVGGYFLAPIEARFISTLTDNKTLVGMAFSAGTVFFAIFSFIIGRLSVRYGKARLITTGAILSVIYPLLYASSINVFQYMGFKIAGAFAGAATGTLLGAYLQDSISKSKSQGKLIGIFHSVHAIAGSFGAILGGYISDSFSLKAPYYAEAIFFIIPAILAIYYIGFNDKKSETAQIKKDDKRSLFFSIGYITRRPELVFNSIVETVFSLNWTMKGILYPLAIYSFTASDTMTGSVFASMGLAATIVLPLAGHFVDKKGYINGLYAAYILIGLGSVMISYSVRYESIGLVFISAIIIAAGEALNGPSRGVLEIKNIENKYRGEILGFYNAYEALIGALSTLFAGIMLNYLGYSEILLIYAIITWIGLLFGVITLKYLNKAFKKRKGNK